MIHIFMYSSPFYGFAYGSVEWRAEISAETQSEHFRS